MAEAILYIKKEKIIANALPALQAWSVSGLQISCMKK
jgi:hypothetical protein